MTITPIQRIKLNRLWFIYGNGGSKHTDLNHKYIQGIIQYDEDREAAYKNADMSAFIATGRDIDKIKLTDECVNAVKEILNGGQ